eukprot:jgi/Tetstr1/438624/TSEL_027175.t1
MADAPGEAAAAAEPAAAAPPPAAPAEALAAAALGVPTAADGREPPAGAEEGSERSRSPSLPPRQRRHAPGRAGGRRSYNLEGLGFCVEVYIDEQYISENGLEVRKVKAYTYTFCEKTLAALRDGVPTTKMQDHLAKCNNLPADKVPELNEATGGTFQRRRANSTRGRRSTQTVVMQPWCLQAQLVALRSKQLETRAIEDWTGVVADNVGYMRNTLTELELMFPNLICIGCVVHVLDLMCEDYAKLVMEYVNMANKIVVFVTGHDRVRQLFLRLKGPQGTALRTFPDTRFSYASLMINSVLTNKRILCDMPDDPAWEDVSTNKDGTPMANREWFVDSIEERRNFLKFSCALALLQPVTDAIRFMEDSVDEEMRSMIEDMLVQEVAAADMEAATSSNNATDDGQQGDGGEQHNGQPGEAGEIVLDAGVRALQRQHAPAAASAAHDAALAATARWCATSGVYRKMPHAHRRAATLTAVQELRRALQALDAADLGMVSDAAAALPVLEAYHPPPPPTDPEYSPAEEPPDLRRAPPSWDDNADEVRREHIRDLDVPSWRLWVNRCLAGRCHSRTAAFLASGTAFALHKDDPAAREERAKTGEPLRVRPLGIGSVLVRLASAHALVHVGAGAREAMGPAHAALSERIASFGTSGYGCHHGAMRLLVVCAVRHTGFLSRNMPPSELDPFLEAVDAANISAAFSLLAYGCRGLAP